MVNLTSTAVTSIVGQSLATVADRLRQTTVLIQGPNGGTGAGVIWGATGLIVTNAHVVPQRQVWATLADGRRFPAQRVAHSLRLDLAALTIAASDLPMVKVGDASALRVGELVMALGHPQGQVGATALGIVHATPAIPRWVQADIQLAPGFSGGPLATLDGHLVGINTLIAGGRGHAIPARLVTRFLGRGQDQPYLGVTVHPQTPSTTAQGTDQVTWRVTQVVPDSPAARAGLGPGDDLLGINGRRFHHPGELADWLDCLVPGQTLTLQVGQRGQVVICILRVGCPPPQEQAA
ncbi:MAG: S1C family serine protease [Nodosilinea sp.]